MKRLIQLLNCSLILCLINIVSAATALAQAIVPASGSTESYLLQYKLQKGETVRWDVEHVASTKTRMAGESEETSSRSVSRKAWKVTDVDKEGNMTFSHSIESVDMWQKIGDDEPIAYNSKSDKKVPFEYEATAARVGKSLAELKVTTDGQVKERKTEIKSVKFGVGDITVPLPKQAIRVGQKWNVPTLLTAVDEDQRPHELKARLAYQLTKVTDQNAYITFKTEILTPVESEKMQSQLMQQKTKGYLVFDIAKGRMIRKEIEWNEKVQGFEGDESYLEYVARMTEKIVDEKSQPTGADVPLNPLKPSESAGKQDRVETADRATIKK